MKAPQQGKNGLFSQDSGAKKCMRRSEDVVLYNLLLTLAVQYREPHPLIGLHAPPGCTWS